MKLLYKTTRKIERFVGNKSTLALICLLAIGSISSSCTTQMEAPNKPSKLAMNSSVVVADFNKESVKKKERVNVNYDLDSLATKMELDSFNNTYSLEQRKVIYALNRMDANRLRLNRSIVIPDTVATDLMVYSPFPDELPLLDSIPQTVLIAQRIQAFGLYENGKLIKWGPVSTGKRSTPTPNGLFYANYKAKRKVSTVNDSWVLPYYFNFMNFEGVGTHQYALPGYPASHGCVRLYMDDAKYIYDWATAWELKGETIIKNGTPYMVFGEYDHREELPWKKLADDMKANDLTDDEFLILESYLKDYKEDPRNFEEDETERSNDNEIV